MMRQLVFLVTLRDEVRLLVQLLVDLFALLVLVNVIDVLVRVRNSVHLYRVHFHGV